MGRTDGVAIFFTSSFTTFLFGLGIVGLGVGVCRVYRASIVHHHVCHCVFSRASTTHRQLNPIETRSGQTGVTISTMSRSPVKSFDEKPDPFSDLDGRKPSIVSGHEIVTVTDLKDADEALAFLENHPRAAEVAAQGQAILDDPKSLARLVRKIDFTIAPLLACVYFLQFLDKTTLSYTAVMGIRTDTHLKGQDYSNLSMLFYIGFLATEFPTQYAGLCSRSTIRTYDPLGI